MFFHFAKAKALIFAVMAGAIACAHGQGDEKPLSSQPIIFSAPHSETGSTTPSVVPERTPQMESSVVPAPEIFNRPVPRIMMPQPQQLPQATKNGEDADIWTLLTPEEILGVESPDKFLKSQQQLDYDKEREGKTPMERFLKRQSDLQVGITNRMSSPNPAFGWDFSRLNGLNEPQNILDRHIGFNSGDNRKDKEKENFLRSSVNDWTMSPQRKNADNKSYLELSADSIAAQKTALARFQQLLEPASATEKPKATKSFSVIDSLGDSASQPQPNPLGKTYKPLDNSIIKPKGIDPLPTLTQPAPVAPVATPSWAPKPAPWLSRTPQPTGIPQRTF